MLWDLDFREFSVWILEQTEEVRREVLATANLLRLGELTMLHNVELIEEFGIWILEQTEEVRREILAKASLLRQGGPQLGRPSVDTVKGSRFKNMKELRVPVGGEPWRVLFAFDPQRSAILLVGGNKGGDKRWYKTHIPIADERFARHLASLGRK
jgi:hypothetical protein